MANAEITSIANFVLPSRSGLNAATKWCKPNSGTKRAEITGRMACFRWVQNFKCRCLPIALAVLTMDARSEISAWNLETRTNTIQHKKNKLANTDKIQGNLYIQLKCRSSYQQGLEVKRRKRTSAWRGMTSSFTWKAKWISHVTTTFCTVKKSLSFRKKLYLGDW